MGALKVVRRGVKRRRLLQRQGEGRRQVLKMKKHGMKAFPSASCLSVGTRRLVDDIYGSICFEANKTSLECIKFTARLPARSGIATCNLRT